MATASFTAHAVQKAAHLKIASLEADWKAARETRILELQTKTTTEGWLWWKTTRTRTEEEALFMYVHGYWPDDLDPHRWYSFPEQTHHADRYGSQIATANRLLALATRLNISSPIQLDESEAQFLRLPILRAIA